jgi:hypothetical protein
MSSVLPSAGRACHRLDADFEAPDRTDTMNMLHTGLIMAEGAAPAPYLYTDTAFSTTWDYWRAPFDFDDGWHTVPEGVTTFVDGRKFVRAEERYCEMNEHGRREEQCWLGIQRREHRARSARCFQRISLRQQGVQRCTVRR